jgi:glutamyl-tRNA synthetase
MTDKTPARVRMAPSPTGPFHLGSARTALFNWLYAHHTGGPFILRIEDTDQTRLVPGSLEDIMHSLRWLGLQWDEGPEVGGPHPPYFQSKRLHLYQEWTEWLIQNGCAYRCYCTEERLVALRQEQSASKEAQGYDRHCRYLTADEQARLAASGISSVVRFAMPLEGETTFTDLLRGPISFPNDKIVDPIVLKSDGYPTYHLANVVDDHFMDITHILRGDEWLSSVPLHVNLYRAFGWDIPVFAHLPLILDPSGHGKLSKRKKREPGAPELLTFVSEYREAGYLPEAMFNFLATLGWSYSPDTDLFSREQAIEAFDISAINPSPGALPLTKLEWMNGHYIRALSIPDLTERLLPFLSRQLGRPVEELREDPALPVLVPLIQERLKTLADAGSLIDFAFVDEIIYEPRDLVAKGLDVASSLAALEAANRVLAEVPFTSDAIEGALRELVVSLGLKAGQLFGILRVAITGKAVAPPLFGSIIAVDRQKALERCVRAEELLRSLQ